LNDRFFNLSASDEGGPDSVNLNHQDQQRLKMQKFPKANLHFSHFFNSYTKYLNIKYKRHGSLFERQFKRKEVNSMRYFKAVVLYIHQNPVHHGFCQHPLEYGWSSYLSIISIKPSKLNRTVVLGWFDDKVNFKRLHDKKIDIDSIDKYLGL
jgi:putative transposase